MFAVAAALVAGASIGGSGVAQADWTTAAIGSSASSSAATTSVTVGSLAGLSTAYKFPIASASPAIITAVLLSNTGTAPLAYTLSTVSTTGTLSPASVTLTLWASAGSTCAATIPGTGSTVGTLAAPPTLPAGAATGAPTTSITLCAATTLGTTVLASRGQSLSATLRVTGKVGTNWTATATAPAFTQSVFTLLAPGNTTCTALGGLLGVTISWAAPAGTVTGDTVTYQIIRDSNGAVVRAGQSATSVTLYSSDVVGGNSAFHVLASTAVYGMTSVGASFSVGTLLSLGLLLTTCP